jgi:hypothetical protein
VLPADLSCARCEHCTHEIVVGHAQLPPCNQGLTAQHATLNCAATLSAAAATCTTRDAPYTTVLVLT